MISAVVLTKNEEKNIEQCLKTLRWCDEIIIVDDYSEDGTVKKIKNEKLKMKNDNVKLKIFKRHLDNDFAGQRNFGQDMATGDWVLFVDADERVTNELSEELKKITQKGATAENCANGFFLKRRDFLFGRWLKHGETGNIKLLRLARKGIGKWVRPIHETWQVNGEIGELVNPLLHYPHQTIKEFLEDINFYTSLNAKVFYKQEVKVSHWEIIAYPMAKFIKNYFLSLGFLDGMAGFLEASFMSFHSFLTRAKLWLFWEEK